MVTSFILIDTQDDKKHETRNRLSRHKSIRDIMPVWGKHDLVAHVETQDLDELNRLILEEIHNDPHIKQASTLVAI